MRVFRIFLAAFLTLVFAAPVYAKDAPRVLLAEAQCYGDEELLPEILYAFSSRLGAPLEKNGAVLLYRDLASLTNEEGRHGGGTAEDAALSTMHMDAIVRSHAYERGFAGVRLIKYGDAALGRDYFLDEERAALWQKSKEPYALGAEPTAAGQEIARRYGADYLLFCHLDDLNVRLKHSLFASHTDKETRGKKLGLKLDYYLFNARTGLVTEGHIESKKTAELENFGLFKRGEGMEIEAVLGTVMDDLAARLAKDMKKKL